jgi:DNA-binding response OmpR family regulator
MNDNPAARTSITPVLSSQTILVVDDDAAMRTILNFTLAAFGYLVLTAENGEAALQVAGDHPKIRLILLDVVMTGLSGKQLANRLQIELPKAVILFCSGHPPEAMSLHGINVAFEHFMQKPFQPPELRRKMEELLAIR